MAANQEQVTIFDGHNDVLLRLRKQDGSFFERAEDAQLDFPRAREGGFGGGFFAVFIPGTSEEAPPASTAAQGAADASLSAYGDTKIMPPTPDLPTAQAKALGMTADLFRLEDQSGGRVKVVRTADELAECLANGILAAILHFEGAEAIDEDLEALDVFYRAGLRSIGPVWSRPNRFAEGVPFAFPSSPDTGPGLTEAGKALIRACNRLGVMIDLSHLNEKGFWEVQKLSTAPLVATHSNAHAICGASRNLTDRQLEAIRASDGMVGVNFHVGFLRPDGKNDRETPLTVVANHVDYLVERLGIDRVGFGSDFDGATMPRELTDAAGLPRLVETLRQRGYGEADLRKIGHENWVRVLRATWH
ncbi:MAG TPA: dipeptidase [Chloroflexota bacterium]|nr:dipeptidase [Chloroflexota bacterium]